MKITSNKNSISQCNSPIYKVLTLAILLMPFYLSLSTSCADQGIGPSGGPKDSIPPEIVDCIPANLQTQFSGKEIQISFNEFVVADNLNEKLIISPPLGKKPTIKINGKSLFVKLEEDLIPDRTYSFDFTDGIKDYNESNKLSNLRLIFSTGDQIDSLRASGYIYDAITLEPVPNALAVLYSDDNDSLFRKLHPDFLAITDDKGFFVFDNLPAGEYTLYGIKDDDKNLFFSNLSELIAFSDSLIKPSVQFVEKIDTIITETDTIISRGYTKFMPENLKLLLFQDDFYSQYLMSFKRETNDKCLFIFSEPITDSLNIELVGNDSNTDWKEVEFSQKKDSILMWITDSIIAKKDTLLFKVTYTNSDSTRNISLFTDTLKMIYGKPLKEQVKQGKEKPISNTDNFFKFSNNLTTSGFDLNSKVMIESPSPIRHVSSGLFNLMEIINDSTSNPIVYQITPVEGTRRKFILDFQLKENTKYELSIDSAVIKTISGIPNARFSTKFTTQKKDYYGTVILNITGLERSGIIRLIKNNKEESLVKEVKYDPSIKSVVFDYLKPEKYLLKFIDDLNNNGEWDTGLLSEKRQPEPVYYLQKELTVKSNWELKENWEILSGTIQGKAFVKPTTNSKKTGKQ
jgi:hypothetical protein